MRFDAPRASIATLLIAVALVPVAACAADGGFQLGFNAGLDSGPYRGGGTGWGYGIEAGWHVSPRWGMFGIFDIGTSDRGDADPISRIAIEARARRILGDASGSAPPSSLRAYVSVGAGAGIVAYPLARVDGALVTVLAELGIELGQVDRWNVGLSLRERPMLTIGGGDPAFSFLNRIGPVIWVRF